MVTRLEYMPPLSLPRVAAGALATSSAASVFVEPPGTDRTFTRYAPAFIDDPAGTGLFAGLGADTYHSPPAFITALPDATLFGYRAMAWDGRFCTDEAWSDPAVAQQALATLSQADAFPNEDTGLRPTPGGIAFELAAEGRATRHVGETAVVLCSHEPSNYGSFLFRTLPKLNAVRRYGLERFRVVAWAHTPSFRGLLALAGVPEAHIIQHDPHMLTRFDRVLAPSLRNPHAFLDAESHAFYQALAQRASSPDAASMRHGRRLYISRMGQARRGASSRQMVNEAEVAAAVSRLGFELIEPETLTPAEQVSTFASAGVLVGPAGSGMFNVVFCRPGTKVVDIESEPNWIYAHTGLFASCGTQYGLFVGEVDPTDTAPVHRRFTVNVPALTSRLEHFLRG